MPLFGSTGSWRINTSGTTRLEHCLVFCAVFFLAVIVQQTFPRPLMCQEGQSSPTASHKTVATPEEYLGSWTGARLRCRRDESGPVRCGTPSAFKMSLRPDGTGTCMGEDFPPEFLHGFSDDGKLIIASTDKSRQWKFFDLKLAEGFLTFHLYIYPGGVESEEAEYIHYVFDLARDQGAPVPANTDR